MPWNACVGYPQMLHATEDMEAVGPKAPAEVQVV
jgi:hypothetical protein